MTTLLLQEQRATFSEITKKKKKESIKKKQVKT